KQCRRFRTSPLWIWNSRRHHSQRTLRNGATMYLGKGKMLVTALGVALGMALVSGTVWAQSGADAIAKPSARTSSPKIVAGQILSRWAPIAEAAGMDMVLWRDQYSAQLGTMSPQALHIIDAAAPVAGASAAANYTRFTEAFKSSMMQMYASGALTKTNAKLGS